MPVTRATGTATERFAPAANRPDKNATTIMKETPTSALVMTPVGVSARGIPLRRVLTTQMAAASVAVAAYTRVPALLLIRPAESLRKKSADASDSAHPSA